MDGTDSLKEATRATAPIASNTANSNTLSVNVFYRPGKAMVGERPKPFGEALGFDPRIGVANQSWLMFGFPGA
jgi:hypothetical protein